jgi:hypothetical protein
VLSRKGKVVIVLVKSEADDKAKLEIANFGHVKRLELPPRMKASNLRIILA